MKFYTKKFDLAMPVLNQINIPDNSDYIIGLEFAKNGTRIEMALADVKLVLGETEISPMETKINGYIPFKMSAGAGRDAKTYDVVLDSDEIKGKFKLAVVVEDADVGDLDIGGGGSGGYAAGDGIEIEDGTISVSDEVAKKDDIPTYSAGDGINIEDGEISVTDEIAKNADIPTVVSELTNDVGYITEGELPTINMDVELEDGTTVTYVIYGQEQQ